MKRKEEIKIKIANYYQENIDDCLNFVHCKMHMNANEIRVKNDLFVSFQFLFPINFPNSELVFYISMNK